MVINISVVTTSSSYSSFSWTNSRSRRLMVCDVVLARAWVLTKPWLELMLVYMIRKTMQGKAYAFYYWSSSILYLCQISEGFTCSLPSTGSAVLDVVLYYILAVSLFDIFHLTPVWVLDQMHPKNCRDTHLVEYLTAGRWRPKAPQNWSDTHSVCLNMKVVLS